MIKAKNGHAVIAGSTNGKKEIPFSGVLIVGGSNADYYIAYTMLKRHKPSVSLLHVIDVKSALNVLNSFKPIKDPYLILLDVKQDKQKNKDVDHVKQFKALLPDHHAGTKVMLLTANSRFEDKRFFEEKISLTEAIEKPFSVEKLISGLSGFSSS